MKQFILGQLRRDDFVGRTLRFVPVGGTSALINVTFVTLYVLSGRDPQVGNALGFVLGTLFQLVFHHFYTFRGHGKVWWKAALAYLPSRVIVFFAQQLIFAWLLPIVSFPAIGTIAATAATMIFSLLWGNFFSHQKKKN